MQDQKQNDSKPNKIEIASTNKEIQTKESKQKNTNTSNQVKSKQTNKTQTNKKQTNKKQTSKQASCQCECLVRHDNKLQLSGHNNHFELHHHYIRSDLSAKSSISSPRHSRITFDKHTTSLMCGLPTMFTGTSD